MEGTDCPVPPNTQVLVGLREGPEGDPLIANDPVPDEAGEWATILTVPPDADPGDYEVFGFCQEGEDPDETDPQYGSEPFTVTPADGEEEADVLPMTIDPNSGPPGAEITVEGTDCPAPPNTKVTLRFFKLGGDPFFELVASGEAEPGEGGQWITTVTVPETEPGDYEMHGSCQTGTEPEMSDPQYDPQPFEVTDSIFILDRSIGLRRAPMRNRGVARGRVRLADPEAAPECVGKVPVRVQRRPLSGGKWKVVRKPRTNAEGVYRTAKAILRRDGRPRPGRYRAVAPRLTTEPGDTCLRAVSPVQRVSR